MRHDGGDTLKSQDYHAGLRVLPLKAMECEKFQALCLLVGLDTIIDLSMDSAKLKLAQVILSEREKAWHHEVDVVLIPLLHLDNPPCAHVLIAHWVLLYLRFY